MTPAHKQGERHPMTLKPCPRDETLFAWTSVGDYRYYPQFVNVSLIGGRLRIMVRALEDTSGEHPVPGTVSEMFLPDEEIPLLVAALSTRINEARNSNEPLVERVRGAIYGVFDQRPFTRVGQDTIDELTRAVIEACGIEAMTEERRKTLFERMSEAQSMSNEPLVERLRRKDQPFGWTGYNGDVWCEYANPDGPEAADEIERLEASERRLREALADAREAIASLDEDALGVDDRQNYLCDPHPPYPLRDELLAKIDAALGEQP